MAVLPLGIVLMLSAATTAPASRPGPFLELALGWSAPRPADLRIVQPDRGRDFTVRSLAFDDKSFDLPVWYSARAGWLLPRPSWLAIGVEFIHPKLYARTGDTRPIAGTRDGALIDTVAVVRSYVERFNISHGDNYLALEALAHRAVGPFEAYLGIGLGPVIAHPENVVEGRRNRERYEVAGLGLLGLLGTRIFPGRRLGLGAEYKFTRARIEVSLAEGQGRLTERTHHLSVGLSFRP